MRNKLEFKRGHMKDMYFAVEKPTDERYLIRKIFYKRDKCLTFIHSENKERHNEVTDAKWQHPGERNPRD